MTAYTHFGLYFSPDHVQTALKNRNVEPFRSAWAALLNQQPTDSLAAAQWDGLRYRFNADAAAGERAVVALAEGIGLTPETSTLQTLANAVTTAQTFEMLADHPAFSWTAQGRWATRFAAHVDKLAKGTAELSYVEGLWLGLLQLVAGIVLEDESRLDAGAAAYRHTITQDIRPEGYIAQLVEGGDGESLYHEFLAVEALVLMAEAASHIGLDLWGYTSRGVSVLTASAYLIYYYYYPEKWPWDTVAESDAKDLFKQHGGFLEMLNHHAHPKDIKPLLDALRPCRSAPAGGLTTLTHGLPQRRGLFGKSN
jgi:hypothetical protein